MWADERPTEFLVFRIVPISGYIAAASPAADKDFLALKRSYFPETKLYSRAFATINFVKTRCWFSINVLLLSTALSAHTPAAPGDKTLIVAAAANLSEVFKEVSAAFTAETGIRVTLSFGSTQQLTQQIENGAPFDVFAAADTEHIDRLASRGLVAQGTNVAYARGFLVLWCPAAESVKTLSDLRTAPIRFLAVAKPEVAPYGKAAVEVLHRAGLWESVEKKVVYAENVTLAKQYVSSANAECGFVAKSLIRDQTKGVVAVDPTLYQPIRQSVGVLQAAQHSTAAKHFIDFLLSGKGQKILANWGYAPAA